MRVGDECVAAVVGDVEPLVAVGGPGIGRAGSGAQVTKARTGIGPESEGAVDVYPRVVAPGDGNQLLERVEDAGVELARLQNDDGWPIVICVVIGAMICMVIGGGICGQGLLECLWIEAA